MDQNETIRLAFGVTGTDQVKTAAKAVDDLGKAAEKTQNKMAGLGQAGLQTGRIIQDFAQGGIAGILNNVEGLAMALGGGPGLAGILTGLGVAFFVLKEPIKQFWESLTGTDADYTKSLFNEIKDKIKAINEKPIKIGVDQIELDNLENQLKRLIAGKAEFDRIMGHQTEREKSSGQQLSEYLSKPEGKKAVEAAKNAAGQAAIQTSAAVQMADAKVTEAEKKLAFYKQDPKFDTVMLERAVDEAKANALAARNQASDTGQDRFKAALAASRSGTGDEQSKAQGEIAAAMRLAGLKNVASNVEHFNPANPEFKSQADLDKEEAKARNAREFADKQRADKEKAAKEAEADQKEKMETQRRLDEKTKRENDESFKHFMRGQQKDTDIADRKAAAEGKLKDKAVNEYDARLDIKARANLAGKGDDMVKNALLSARSQGLTGMQEETLAAHQIAGLLMASGQAKSPFEAGAIATKMVSAVIPSFEAQFGANNRRVTDANTKQTERLTKQIEQLNKGVYVRVGP